MTQTARPQFIEIFERSAAEAGADVERIAASPAEVSAAVRRIARGARSLVVASTELLAPELHNAILTIPGAILEPNDEQLAMAEAGITEAFAGVASTGSVCIAMGPPLTAVASLLMPLHIVLLSADRIVARPSDIFDPSCFEGQGLKRNFVLVTGPSATADMGPLVHGVHGPQHVHVLLLG